MDDFYSIPGITLDRKSIESYTCVAHTHLYSRDAEHDKYDEQTPKHEDKTKIDIKAYYLYVSPQFSAVF